jgi:2-polyprenyl-6-methoxyphenol hydroxylase-like FAD-dependent oxidoreductase
MLGIEREVVSPNHSICVGFDVKPAHGLAFPFRALTYHAERPSDRLAFLTLFPIGSSMRANFFCYRDMHDPWLRQLRHFPEQTLQAAMPKLRRVIGEFIVTSPVKIRPADLYVTKGHVQPGVVLVGDAFSTSCPAAGTGTGKVFNDVERLCNIHIPHWLASEGMGAEKIAAFYDDPVKRAYDVHSAAKAYQLRALSIEPGLSWEARRWARFMVRLGIGSLRQARERLSAGPMGRVAAAADSNTV